MLLVSTKTTGVFSKGKYKFLPGKPVLVTNPHDIADLLQKSFIKKYEPNDKITYIDELDIQDKQKQSEYNIGIIRFGGIGDCLMLHGIAGNIKYKYPSSFITVYIIQNDASEQLLEYSQYIDKIIVCNTRDSVISTENRLKKQYDILYSLHLDVKKFEHGELVINKKVLIHNGN